MDGPDHLAHLRDDTLAFAATVDPTSVTAPVPGCPGWDLRTLAGHLGWVHRWAAAAVRTGSPPDAAAIEPPPESAAELAAWLLAGGEALAEELARVDPGAPTWHPFPAPMVAGVWRRRQAQETSVHRWDAQSARDEPRAIDPVLAADGVGEYFEMMLPRRFERDGGVPPARPEWLRVEANDTAGSWWVRTVDRRVELGGVDEVVDAPAATLRGRAEDLLLALYARRAPSALEVDGDPTLVSDWLALGGN
jgi:uncharacterized protein (TIGR03083 family)